jgi:uncharacterized SAM-binding protein YcdF (DUF218 family)
MRRKATLRARAAAISVSLAVATPALSRGEFSVVVADALALLCPGAREAAVIHLFKTGAVGRLAAAVAEQAGAIYREIATPVAFSGGIQQIDLALQQPCVTGHEIFRDSAPAGGSFRLEEPRKTGCRVSS